MSRPEIVSVQTVEAAVISEETIVSRCRESLSRNNWLIGEQASLWKQRFARGRTDADFAVLIGLTTDQVYQRRIVWETFADVRDEYPALSWSHFYAAAYWDNAAECLQWAQEVEATVKEMQAWRRAYRDDETTDAHQSGNESDLPDGEFGDRDQTAATEDAETSEPDQPAQIRERKTKPDEHDAPRAVDIDTLLETLTLLVEQVLERNTDADRERVKRTLERLLEQLG